MARRIVWTVACFQDLEHTYQYIVLDSARYAKSFAAEVMRRVRWLRRNSDFGAVVPEFDDQYIREVRVGRHRLIYKLADESAVLLGLIHGARDLTSLWQQERRPR